MTPARIRVLVVDDSGFMRRAITKMLASAEDIEVVGSASTGEEALTLEPQLRPDIITMDVEMPGMGGLEAARAIIARRGPPVIMISSLTREGAETTLRALEIGAVDFIPKPDSATIDIIRVKDDLIEKVRLFGTRFALRRTLTTRLAPPPAPRPSSAPAAPAVTAPAQPPSPARVAPVASAGGRRIGPFECVAIGTSTGGPVALATVLPKLPASFPLPILIVQHMPPGFTKALADRLNAASEIAVVEGQNGMRLERGTAIIAPAGQQLTLRRSGAHVEVRLDADLRKSLHVPSVDVLAAAVGETFGAASLGVILTGMGHDGVSGLAVIKKNGGYVIGQDEASAVVYGMPRAAAVAGLVDRVVALNDVARALCDVAGAAYTVR
ncbi:MAG: chemotaxis response regulator protein-glutamate methylesterase [Candidatus Velthaea sp.]